MYRKSKGAILSTMNKQKKHIILGILALSVSLCSLISCTNTPSQLGGGAFTLPEQTTTENAADTPSADTSSDTPAADTAFPVYDYTSLDLGALVTLPEDYRTRDYSDGLTLLGAPSDEDVEAEIRSSYLISLATYPEHGEGADAELKDLDRVVMDYKGTLDGVAFQGGTATDTTHDISILHSQFIDGFDRGMLGMKTGETRELNLKFPEDYGNASLAGKEVVFTVTVDKIIRPNIPALTDDLVAANPKVFGEDHTTVTTFRQSVTDYLTAQNEASDEQQLKNAALSYLSENTEYHSMPEDMLNGYINFYYSYYLSMAEDYGKSIEEFVTQAGYLSLDSFKQEVIVATAENTIKKKLIIYSAARDLGISISDEQAQTQAQEEFKTYIEPNLTYYTVYYGISDFDSYLESMYGGMNEFKDSLLYVKILDEICK